MNNNRQKTEIKRAIELLRLAHGGVGDAKDQVEAVGGDLDPRVGKLEAILDDIEYDIQLLKAFLIDDL